ncbi:MAG: acetyl-CoA carboxylase carboxyltransferase subunit alpha [Chromatiales bacterium]|nr:acetyl-CoA carboxylase carboxyltransferase subunit alpha [Chromatiales bacterium]
MSVNFLDFERPIADLEEKIEELRHVDSDPGVNIGEEIDRLRSKSEALTRSIFGKLTPWQVARLARHPRRPYTLDYLSRAFTEFTELHGDRYFADDGAIVGGVARLDGHPVVVVGHQKGRTTKENIGRSFGMPRPEGYRKALRLFRMAERFRTPVVTFIDTPGAYPGVGAEERGQSEAIARNLHVLSTLDVPVLCTVIGEGGSGGALAIGVADRVVMLQYGTYSVISPEGCASILWKSADRAADAAKAMGITSDRLMELGLIDRIVTEPLGGAHRDPDTMAESLQAVLVEELEALVGMDVEVLKRRRYQRLMSYGRFRDEGSEIGSR